MIQIRYKKFLIGIVLTIFFFISVQYTFANQEGFNYILTDEIGEQDQDRIQEKIKNKDYNHDCDCDQTCGEDCDCECHGDCDEDCDGTPDRIRDKDQTNK